MHFNSCSLLKLTLATAFALEANAMDLKPWGTDHHPGDQSFAKRAPAPLELAPMRPVEVHSNVFGRRALPSVELKAISDPGILRRGRSEKRDMPGNGCFDPAKHSTFFWGGYAGDNIFVANFTMSAQTDDEYILAVENFAKRMKSIKCGTPGQPMILEFSDADSLKYAKSAWKWIDDADINHFTLVTEPDMCYKGDNRSPYLVSAIKFDDANLKAEITAEEKPWDEIAQSFNLNLGHEYVDPATANVTHPHLARRGDDGTQMDISYTFNGELFNYAKDSKETAGMALSANLELTTAGTIVTDFDIKKNWLGIPNDATLNIHPQGVNGLMKLKLNADGKLGKELQWDMKPEIEIPVQALKIAGILEIGPFITMGVHMGSSALEGTSEMSVGAKAKIKDEAKVDVRLTKPEENELSGWEPDFEKIDPEFSAEIGGNIRAWSELGVQLKAEVFGRWGYQAAVDAQLPFFEAKMSGIVDTVGVCDSQKTVGVQLGTDVGINVNLNAGKVNEAPSFEKDLFEKTWPLYSTCIPIGPDNAKPTETPEPEPPKEPKPGPTEEPSEPVVTEQPSNEAPKTDEGPMETGTGSMPMITGAPSVITGSEVAQQPDIGYAPDHDKYLARGQRRLEAGNLGTSLPPGFPSELKSPLVWDNTYIAKRFDWTYELTATDLEEVEEALEHFKSMKKPLGRVNQETFPLPKLHDILREISHEIHHAFGFKVIRGLPVSPHTREEIITIYAGIASHIAPIRGHLSKTHDASKIGAPAYTTDKQVFHTDSGDVIALLSLEEAAEGGESKLSSSWRVYNELARTRPDLIRTLAEPWPAENPYISRPLLHHQPATDSSPERLIIQYARRTFTGFQGLPRSTDIPPITEAQAEALDALHIVAEKYAVSLNFKKGDVQFANNLSIFHARDGFTDTEEKQRHLVRLWVRDPDNA
ncbi:hypothetical protein E8E12_009870 [Didymella heteroderae]|uniref:TauD/TfdA-like domain-containing protein n=1 Tax=Didymella heteroderae TaxID=1769908 RepID=A0A9P4WXZ9_9PLEO|nr:hypothetical protein E8E12_009870 [Didymella heteroderae]